MTARGTSVRRAIQHEDHPSPIPAGKATMSIPKHFVGRSHEVWTGALSIVLSAITVSLGHGQSQTGGATKGVLEQRIASDLYFIYDETSSNSAFLVTEDGVLVVDTRQHPRDGQDLLNRIRRLTDKPIRAQRYCAHHGAGR